MKHTSDFGSQIAKNGFKNEKDVISKFNNWEKDKDAQGWLEEMGYDLRKINKIEAIDGKEAKLRLRDQGMKFDSGNVKTDVSVLVTVHLKNMVEPQNISVKLVTAKYSITKKSYSGFNQIDKREVDNYTKLWNMPDSLVKTLKYFTGKISPNITNSRDERRMYLNEMEPSSVKELVNFFEKNKVLVISDIIRGRGALSAEWMLVALNKTEDGKPKQTIWTFKSINEVINYYSQGGIKITKDGNFAVARIKAQRKGGDNGRESAKTLQFKFDPLELLFPKP
jgi:R.HinP1I restriction endonuclease